MGASFGKDPGSPQKNEDEGLTSNEQDSDVVMAQHFQHLVKFAYRRVKKMELSEEKKVDYERQGQQVMEETKNALVVMKSLRKLRSKLPKEAFFQKQKTELERLVVQATVAEGFMEDTRPCRSEKEIKRMQGYAFYFKDRIEILEKRGEERRCKRKSKGNSLEKTNTESLLRLYTDIQFARREFDALLKQANYLRENISKISADTADPEKKHLKEKMGLELSYIRHQTVQQLKKTEEEVTALKKLHEDLVHDQQTASFP